MLRLKQIFSTGKTINHFVSAWEMDRALCGQDLAGDDNVDDRGKYEAAEGTLDKVNCREFITIVEHCKAIKREEWVSKRKTLLK
jgi:hypothetical protein